MRFLLVADGQTERCINGQRSLTGKNPKKPDKLHRTKPIKGFRTNTRQIKF